MENQLQKDIQVIDLQFKIDDQLYYQEELKQTIEQILDQVQKNKHYNICLEMSNKTVRNEVEDEFTTNKFLLNKDKVLDFSLSKTGIVLLDKNCIQKQRTILGHVLKQIGLNLLKRQSIMNISFPIGMFNAQSLLQRIAYGYSFCPYFLKKSGSKQVDMENKEKLMEIIIEQMVESLGVFFSSLSLQMCQYKPFNPVLGETHESHFGNTGIRIDLEQVSHHPAISRLLISDEEGLFRVEGNYEVLMHTGVNSITGHNNGKLNYHFKNTNVTLNFQPPKYYIYGTLIGQREFNFSNYSYIIDYQHQLVAMVEFSPEVKTRQDKFKLSNNYFKGVVFKASKKFMDLLASHKKKSTYIPDIPFKQDYADHVYGYIEGEWLSYMNYNDQTVFDLNTLQPYKCLSNPYKLPSDSFFREDSLLMKLGDEKKAQAAKDLIENIQRNDKKLRTPQLKK